MFWLVAIIIALCLFIYYDRSKFRYWTRKGVKQETPMPVLSDNGKLFIKKMAFCDYIKEVYDRFSEVRYYGTYQFYQPLLVLRDPKLIKKICVKDFEYFLDHRAFVNEDTDPLWNKNLISLKGQKWKEMRSTLSPFFTGSKMRQMFALMHECARNFANFVALRPEKEIQIELKDAFTRYANDMIATTAFGIHCNSLKDKDDEFYLRGKEATNITGFWKNMKLLINLLLPFVAKITGAGFFDKKTSDFFRGVVRDSLKYREEHKTERPDLINLLHKANRGHLKDEEEIADETNFAAVKEHLEHKATTKGNLNLSLDDITSQALSFFFAGFETVSTTMCFVAYELAVNQDVQKRLIAELDEFKKSDEKFSYESLAKLPYLDMVLCETLRKWPASIVTDRVCRKNYVIEPENNEEHSLVVEPMEAMLIPIWGLHRDPKYWENPTKFDPERFSPENRHKIDPYTYIPFGVGPRNCIGSRFALTEVKVVFFELLSRYEIIPNEKSCIPFVPDPKSFMLASNNGFWFTLKKREV